MENRGRAWGCEICARAYARHRRRILHSRLTGSPPTNRPTPFPPLFATFFQHLLLRGISVDVHRPRKRMKGGWECLGSLALQAGSLETLPIPLRGQGFTWTTYGDPHNNTENRNHFHPPTKMHHYPNSSANHCALRRPPPSKERRKEGKKERRKVGKKERRKEGKERMERMGALGRSRHTWRLCGSVCIIFP